MSDSSLCVTFQADGKSVCVPGGHALISTTGLFVRDIQLLVGTRVLVQIRRGRDEVSLQGTVSASYTEFGLSVEFKDGGGLAIQKLAALLAE